MGLVSRFILSAAALAALSASAAADPQYGNNLGGGFIELLVTGSTGRGGASYASPYQPQEPAPRMMAPRAMAPAYAAPRTTAALSSLPDEQYEPAPAARGNLAPMPTVSGFDPKFERQVVSYNGGHRPGTIVIDTPNKFLYLVQEGGKAMRYGIGVGRPGFEWAGVKSVTRKAEWPNWTPPPEMLKRRPDLPRFMAGGPDNPLGARALYLGSSLYRIHGTNEPSTIGQAVSSGCIRLRNEDVSDLYDRVRVGAKVVVM